MFNEPWFVYIECEDYEIPFSDGMSISTKYWVLVVPNEDDPVDPICYINDNYTYDEQVAIAETIVKAHNATIQGD